MGTRGHAHPFCFRVVRALHLLLVWHTSPTTAFLRPTMAPTRSQALKVLRLASTQCHKTTVRSFTILSRAPIRPILDLPYRSLLLFLTYFSLATRLSSSRALFRSKPPLH